MDKLEHHLIFFPPEFLNLDKLALKTMGSCPWIFRTNLNANYVQKGHKPFERYGFITPDDWKNFVDKMTSENALKTSKSFQNLSKKSL